MHATVKRTLARTQHSRACMHTTHDARHTLNLYVHAPFVKDMVSVYKKRGTPLYPFTCARAVGVVPTVTPSKTGEVSQGKTKAQDNQSNAKAKTTRSRGTKQAPPARPLPGKLAPHQQSEPPLSPRSPTPSSALGQGSGRYL